MDNSKQISREQWAEIRNAAFLHVSQYPHIRIGQALFNILYTRFPEIADSVRATSCDPFQENDYSSQRIKDFYDKIVKQD